MGRLLRRARAAGPAANLAHREQCRVNLAADPDWKAYQRDSPKVIVTMENRILVPVPFSPLK